MNWGIEIWYSLLSVVFFLISVSLPLYWLMIHVLSWFTGIKLYSCDVCNYNGVTQSDLNRHKKTQSHIARSQNVCSMCGLGFYTSSQKQVRIFHISCYWVAILKFQILCKIYGIWYIISFCSIEIRWKPLLYMWIVVDFVIICRYMLFSVTLK